MGHRPPLAPEHSTATAAMPSEMPCVLVGEEEGLVRSWLSLPSWEVSGPLKSHRDALAGRLSWL